MPSTHEKTLIIAELRKELAALKQSFRNRVNKTKKQQRVKLEKELGKPVKFKVRRFIRTKEVVKEVIVPIKKTKGGSFAEVTAQLIAIDAFATKNGITIHQFAFLCAVNSLEVANSRHLSAFGYTSKHSCGMAELLSKSGHIEIFRSGKKMNTFVLSLKSKKLFSSFIQWIDQNNAEQTS